MFGVRIPKSPIILYCENHVYYYFMKFSIVVIFFIFFGCTETRDARDDKLNDAQVFNKDAVVSSAWICYHPDTQFHDKVCVEAVYPQGCYVEGDNTKFCWLLSAEDCENFSISKPGWYDVCRKLGK